MIDLPRGPDRRHLPERRRDNRPFSGADRRVGPTDRRRSVPERREELNVSLIAFNCAEVFYGVPIGHVYEINKQLEATPVARAADYFRGLINLRGEIIPLIDLRARLKLPPAPDTPLTSNIIISASGGHCGLVVDEVVDAVSVDKDAIDGPPANLAPDIAPFVQGICPVGDRFLIVLGAAALTETWRPENQ